MNKNHAMAGWLVLLALSALNAPSTTVFAQGSAFSYQGRLNDHTNPANGIYDLRFTVYDSANTPGNLIAGPMTVAATRVANGLFSATLDFGTGVFTGRGRWLEVAVRTNGGGVFTVLAPRQPLLPSPYAVMANSASNLLGTLPAVQLTGTLPVTALPSSALTNNARGVTLNGSFVGNGAGLTNLNAGSLAPGSGVIPSGGIVLSATASNAALTSAGFALMVNPLGGGWTQATNTAPWSARSLYPVVAVNGQMWVMGGGTDYGPTNDVWSSSNGVTWTQASRTVPWGGRDSFGVVAFNGQMWVMGGRTSHNYYNDVWSSSNGVTWTRATSAAPWGGQQGVVAFNGQMWVMGVDFGGLVYDVWSSSNGVTWTRATSAAPWGGRAGFGVVALNGQLWVMGGTGNGYLNDVWFLENASMLGGFFLFQKQ